MRAQEFDQLLDDEDGELLSTSLGGRSYRKWIGGGLVAVLLVLACGFEGKKTLAIFRVADFTILEKEVADERKDKWGEHTYQCYWGSSTWCPRGSQSGWTTCSCGWGKIGDIGSVSGTSECIDWACLPADYRDKKTKCKGSETGGRAAQQNKDITGGAGDRYSLREYLGCKLFDELKNQATQRRRVLQDEAQDQTALAEEITTELLDEAKENPDKTVKGWKAWFDEKKEKYDEVPGVASDTYTFLDIIKSVIKEGTSAPFPGPQI